MALVASLGTRPALGARARSSSSSGSRPSSGQSARSAGRLILGSMPSEERNVTSTANASFAKRSALDMLPSDLQSQLSQAPHSMQNELIEVALAVLSANDADAGTAAMMQQIEPQHQEVPQTERLRWHGALGAAQDWKLPALAAGSDKAARPGYQAYDASEYIDRPEVLRAKAKILAQMFKRSGSNTVIYTGAGLSTASGIGDYASKASNSVAPHKKGASSCNRLELQPTIAHHALASMESKGFIGNWIQQNHDRLAQKAGFPQAKLNEIHGAWGDVKNQVKMMDDTLRIDLLEWLAAWVERADLCVTLGTSLCGMNADQVAQGAAERFAQSRGEGLVVIGLQRTIYDDSASLRIWGLCDDVMKLVAKELDCKIPDPKIASRGKQWVSNHPSCKYNTPKRTAKDPI